MNRERIKLENAIVGCPGIAEGTVRFLRSVEDIPKITEENIIITNNNSPLYSIAFFKSKAIISEVGGSLCHLAIVCREMQKPCIMGVKNIFEILKEGSKIRLNTQKKELEIL
ncbi:PEP-utilizing enzyme [Nanoarchaeota archaeon]